VARLSHPARLAADDQHRRAGRRLYRSGGKTILPNRAVAKIDVRLVPDMTAKGTLQLPEGSPHEHGFGDVEVNMTGGYDPTKRRPTRSSSKRW